MVLKFKLYFSFILINFFFITNTVSQLYLSEEEVIKLTLENYPSIKASNLNIEQKRFLVPTAFNFYNTQLLWQAPTGDDMRISVTQNFEFPTVYFKQKQILNKQVQIAEIEKKTTSKYVIYNTIIAYENLIYALERERKLIQFDSLLKGLIKINEIRFKVGQIALLEKINGEAKYFLINNQLKQAITERKNAQYQLALFLGKVGDTTILPNKNLTKRVFLLANNEVNKVEENPLFDLYTQNISYQKSLLQLEKNKVLPGLMVGYFNQASRTTPLNLRLNYGFTIPLAFWSYNARIKSARKSIELAENEVQFLTIKLTSEYFQAEAKVKQYAESLVFFETIGSQQADQILNASNRSYQTGAINYYIFLQNIDQAFQIKLSYLEILKNYNISLIQLSYLTGTL